MPFLLEVRDLHTYYGGIHALKGVSLAVEEGSIATLIGANGAGKTTTLMAISGIQHPRRGQVLFAGQPIHDLEPHAIVRLGISQVPEGRRILPRMSVLENLEMGAFLRRDRAQIQADLEKAFQYFPILRERQSQPGGTLSGGEQQMLAIGRALMARPRLLLLDEPSLGLAPAFVKAIFAIVREINRAGTTIFLVEQNVHMALAVAHRGYVIETGTIVLADAPERLLDNEAVKKAYLGES
jgi:branched-chain amino acid transport system ATP-binding protein